MDVSALPHVIAGLNAASTVSVIAGWRSVRNGDKAAHRKAMLTALGISILFLVAYVTYHANAGLAKFGGEGIVRPVYFTILISHIVLAGVIAFLVPAAVALAWTGRLERHRRIARWTAPVWVYVTVSGVVVYVMAIHLYPWTGS